MDRRRERDELEEEGEIELQRIMLASCLGKGRVGRAAYGGDEEGEGDGLLGASHGCGWKSSGDERRDEGSATTRRVRSTISGVWVAR